LPANLKRLVIEPINEGKFSDEKFPNSPVSVPVSQQEANGSSNGNLQSDKYQPKRWSSNNLNIASIE